MLGIGPDYWALHPTTGLCTRLLGLAPDSWALHSTTRLSSDHGALHPTTGLCTRLLGITSDCWAFTRLLGFRPNTRLLVENGAYTQIRGCWDLPKAASDHHKTFSQGPGISRTLSEGPGAFRKQRQTSRNGLKIVKIVEMIENGFIWLQMG